MVPSSAPEAVQPGEAPDTYVLRVAGEKARDVASRYPGTWVLAADTIVEIDDTVLGKPRDREEGMRMLRQLSGRSHRVMTAFVIVNDTGQSVTSQLVTSCVRFKHLSEAQIHAYLATGEPFDKAGAYAVQGLGAALVEHVEGSYTNVVGLPLDEVLDELRAAGLVSNEGTQSV